MVLIEIISEGSLTSYLFNEEESLYYACNKALKLHFDECKSVGRLYKITRIGYTLLLPTHEHLQ